MLLITKYPSFQKVSVTIYTYVSNTHTQNLIFAENSFLALFRGERIFCIKTHTEREEERGSEIMFYLHS